MNDSTLQIISIVGMCISMLIVGVYFRNIVEKARMKVRRSQKKAVGKWIQRRVAIARWLVQGTGHVVERPQKAVKATVIGDGGLSADIVRLTAKCGLRMMDEAHGVMFHKNDHPVYGIHNDGDYYLYLTDVAKWVKSHPKQITGKLSSIAPYMPAQVRVPVSATSVEPD